MQAIFLPPDADAAAFRPLARRAIAALIPPEKLAFITGGETLLPAATLPEPKADLRVPRSYAMLLETASMHRSADRFDLLYALLWRIQNGEKELVTRAADPLVARLRTYEKSVRRDIHKMHAFVRFRKTSTQEPPLYVAWFEPEHRILKAAAPFFRDRFTDMDWVIATPDGSAFWRDRQMTFAAAGPRLSETADAVLDDVWLTYYRTTFNPSRLRVKAMTAEMPRRYWRTMPETALLPAMIHGATARASSMREREADQPPRFAAKIAPRPRASAVVTSPLEKLREEAAACKRCALHAHATQTVFGDGPPTASLVFVGEQPGDQEDLAGLPFVGPAGQLFNGALREAGIDRSAVYLTNAVKHFKHEPRGKRRIHKRPNAGEVRACRWWLDRELATLRPRMVVALGATAAQALTGHTITVQSDRGPAKFGALDGFITVHPSFLLRLPDIEAQAREYARFVDDLRTVKEFIAGQHAA